MNICHPKGAWPTDEVWKTHSAWTAPHRIPTSLSSNVIRSIVKSSPLERDYEKGWKMWLIRKVIFVRKKKNVTKKGQQITLSGLKITARWQTSREQAEGKRRHATCQGSSSWVKLLGDEETGLIWEHEPGSISQIPARESGWASAS